MPDAGGASVSKISDDSVYQPFVAELDSLQFKVTRLQARLQELFEGQSLVIEGQSLRLDKHQVRLTKLESGEFGARAVRPENTDAALALPLQVTTLSKEVERLSEADARLDKLESRVVEVESKMAVSLKLESRLAAGEELLNMQPHPEHVHKDVLDKTYQVTSSHSTRIDETEARLEQIESGKHPCLKANKPDQQDRQADIVERVTKLEAAIKRFDEKGVHDQGKGTVVEETVNQFNFETVKNDATTPGRDDAEVCEFTMDLCSAHARDYAIEQSTWDSSLFLGFECVGIGSGLMIVISILVTIAIDILFVGVVLRAYIEDPFDDSILNELLHWRAVSAHDIRNFDPVSHTSLVARVCAGDSALINSATQMQGYESFLKFQKSNGHFLAIMVLALWTSIITQDIVSNWRFTHAVGLTCQGSACMQYRGDQIEVVSLSMLQGGLVVVLACIPRLGISLFLGYAGILFILYTVDIGDMLLNALSLVFIFEIDELLFHALLPQNIKVLMRRVRPLTVSEEASLRKFVSPQIRPSAGGGHVFAFRMVVLVTVLMFCEFLLIAPLNDNMQLAMEYICGGYKDFVYTPNKVTGLISYADSAPFLSELSSSLYGMKAVLEVAGLSSALSNGDADDHRKFANRVSLSNLQALSDSDATYAAGTVACIDHLDETQARQAYPMTYASKTQSVRARLRDIFNGSIESCSEVDYNLWCTTTSTHAVRALCPRHCGCDNPWSGQFFNTGFYGCPTSCVPRWELNANYLPPTVFATYTDFCQDVPVDVLREASSWLSYVKGLQVYVEPFSQTREMAAQVTESLISKGCAHILDMQGTLDICTPNGNFRTARPWCPYTCHCVASDMAECAPSCSHNKRFSVMSPSRTCHASTSVSKPQECMVAAEQHIPGTTQEARLTQDHGNLPPGCWLDTINRKAIWSDATSDVTTIAEGMLALCVQATPLAFDEQSKGNFALGQKMAQCALRDGVWIGGLSGTCQNGTNS